MIDAGVGLICFLPFLILSLVTSLFWVWMLVDCLMNEPSTGNDKLVWALVILLTHILGAAIYFLVRRPQRIRETGK